MSVCPANNYTACLLAGMLSFAYFFFVNICDFSVLRTPEIASGIRIPDFRPSCSCLFARQIITQLRLILYGIFILATVIYILLLRPVGRNRDQDIDLRRRNRISRKKLIITVLCIAAVAGTIWFGKTVLSDRKYYFISLLVLIEMMIPFLTAFETKALGARDIVTVAVLCALATVGRTAFFMIPNFNPVMAIVIISGVAFGCETGFVTGAVTMLVSNMVFGQGPWTLPSFAVTVITAVPALTPFTSPVCDTLATFSLLLFQSNVFSVAFAGITAATAIRSVSPIFNTTLVLFNVIFSISIVSGLQRALSVA